jgi:predicted P-loop ATPase
MSGDKDNAYERDLIASLPEILAIVLPDGVINGHWYTSGDYGINLESGRSSRGQSGTLYENFTAFYAHLRGLTVEAAHERLAEWIENNRKSKVIDLKANIAVNTAKVYLKPAVAITEDWPQTEPPAQHITNIVQLSEDALDSPMMPDKLSVWQMLGVQPNRQGSVGHSADNVFRALEGLPEFKDFAWWDDFHLKYFTTWKAGNCRSTEPREWSEAEDLELMLYFQRTLGLSRVSDKVTNQAMRLYAMRRKRNEPKDWIHSLSWDGVSRIQSFFHKYFGASDSLYTHCASENFWIGIAARVFKPGCKLDNMVVLIGKQGALKSTSVSVVGGKWAAEVSEKVSNKDFSVCIQGKLIIEMSELDSFKNADLSAIKATISRPTDRFRVPYGKTPQDHPRKCVFVGTTNKPQFLRDETGGRRFWPITVGKIDKNSIEQDREQFFAEAFHKFKSSAKWWDMPREATEAIQEEHRQIDDWQEPIQEYIEMRNDVTSLEVAKECLKINDLAKIDFQTTSRICKILAKLGLVNKSVRKGKHVVKRWVKVTEMLQPTFSQVTEIT